MVHCDAICNDVLEVGSAQNKFKARKLNGAFGRFSKNVVDDFQGIY